jgi:hypothetical protein
VNHGEVLFLYQAFFKGKGKFPVRCPVFGKEDKPGRIFVYAVYREDFPAVFCKRKQPVKAFLSLVPAVASNGKAGCLVHRDKALILINYGKERVLFHAKLHKPLMLKVPGSRKDHGDSQAVGRFYRGVVVQGTADLDDGFYARN